MTTTTETPAPLYVSTPDGLADIAQKFVEEGSDGVADWILNNLHGEQYLKDQVKIEKEVK